MWNGTQKEELLFDNLEAKWYFGICRLGLRGTIRRAWIFIQDFLKRSNRHSITKVTGDYVDFQTFVILFFIRN